jgi:spermidine synthase
LSGLPDLLRIGLLSALILFVEMAFIRWVGTEIRIFSYVQNGVLVAAFLGLGLGARGSRQPVRLVPAAAALVFVAAVVRDPFGWGVAEALTQGLAAFKHTQIWGMAASPLDHSWVRLSVVTFALGTTLALLAAIAVGFQPLGQFLGRWMDAHPRPIAAYSANILGSLAGIALFDAATVARTAPWLWLLATGLGLAALAWSAEEKGVARAAAVVLALALPLFGRTPAGFHALWSPYQKLTVGPLVVPTAKDPDAVCGVRVDVNNTYYQVLVDLDPARMAARPEMYPPAEVATSHYVFPSQVVGPRKRVLVVGSGGGNDVAGALRAGAESVDAVEIDPTVAGLGRDLHPNRPYGSPRVRVINDDARAFFRRATGPYDLVLFGLLDSHTSPSAYTNVRLDHFVYTRESFADMGRLLDPSGVVVLFFEPQTWWIADRLAGLLRDTFGAPPLAFMVRSTSPCLGFGGLMMVAGRPPALAVVRQGAEARPDIRARVLPEATFPARTRLTTDDWPYLYLQNPAVPEYHLVLAAACLLIGYVLRRRLFRPGEDLNLAMMLLGAGFMLVEVTGVNRAALLFGTTWVVNAYVVGAVLAMILLANLVAARVRFDPAGWPFAGLVVSLLLLGLVPITVAAGLPPAMRVLVGGAFIALPVFFSGLVFVSVWAAAPRRDLALGSNLLGSLLGGLLSMLSMVIGFRALTFLTLAIYLGALLTIRRRAAAAPAVAA